MTNAVVAGAAPPSNAPAADSAPADDKAPAPQVDGVEDIPRAAPSEEKPAADQKQPDDKQTEQKQPSDEGEDGDEGDRPRRLSRNQRLQRKAAYLSNHAAQLAERVAELEAERETREGKAPDGKTKDEPPKEEDFQGDHIAFIAARAAYEARKAVRGEFADQHKRQQDAATRDAEQEANAEFFERVEDAKQRIPDFDDVVGGYQKTGGQLAPHVREELRDSDAGPALLYHLAKNPDLAQALNRMSPRDAAREIGRLEHQVQLPSPRKASQAPAPLKPLGGGGGASPSRSIAEMAQSDNLDDFVRAREEEVKKRGRR